MGGPPLQRIYDVAPFAVDFIDGDGPDLAIAFASVGHDSARAPSPEFVATASGQCRRRALFVSDASRSWANHPGFEAAVLTAVNWVAARAPLGRVATLGLSMGGFSALVAAQVVPVDAVLAFGPQYSVAPGFGEGRWPEWTKTLPPLRWPVAPLPRSGWTCLFHGTLDDQPQAMGFAVQRGVDHLLFPGLTHSALVPHLKSQGVLSGLLDAALANDRRRLLRIAGSAGGERRVETVARP